MMVSPRGDKIKNWLIIGPFLLFSEQRRQKKVANTRLQIIEE
jgi:hypothetical protein